MGDRCTEKGGLNIPVWHRGKMRILGVRGHKGRNNDVEERGERNNKKQTLGKNVITKPYSL